MKQIDFEHGKITDNILRASIPMLVAEVLSLLYNIVDRIYIARIPDVGTTALGAVGLCFPIITIILAFSNLFGSGGAPLFSIERGRKDTKEASMIMNTSFFLICVCALLLMAVGMIFAKPILLLFGSSENGLIYAYPYLMIYLIGTFPSMVSTGMNPFINAQGYATTGMLSVAIGAVANLILDPLFIFGFHMGMAGAALATIIGQIFSGILVIRYLRRYKNGRLTAAHLRPQETYVSMITSLGAAAFFNQLAMLVVQIVLNKSLTYYGAHSDYGESIPLACAGIITKVNQVFFSIVIGLSQGMQPIASFNYGAKNYARVRQVYGLALRWGFVVSAVSFACFQLIPRPIIGLFGEGSEMYFQFAEKYFRIYLFFTFLNCVQPIASNLFTAIGKPKKGIFLSLTRQILFLLPLIVILPLFIGIDGIMYAGPIADFVAGVVALAMAGVEVKRLRRMESASVHA